VQLSPSHRPRPVFGLGPRRLHPGRGLQQPWRSPDAHGRHPRGRSGPGRVGWPCGRPSGARRPGTEWRAV